MIGALLVAQAAFAVIMVIIIIVVVVVTVPPYRGIILFDRTGNQSLQLATVEPDATALLAHIDRHTLALAFVQN